MHLHLNSNPLEAGSTDWIDLIEGNECPRRLHLDMIEFRLESNFDRLLKALAENSTLEFLSLIGSGPPGRASPETSLLFSQFLEKNNTLQYLDFSGYSGKLEDAHLGWGLSGALGGLKQNETLRQLRIRNHDMGAAEDITELCRIIAVNKGLVMLDMQNNNFDHHQFSKLVHAMQLNDQIISFPVSDADRDKALDIERQDFIKHLKKPFKGSLGKSDGARLEGLLDWLRGHWNSEARKVKTILQRNMDNPRNQDLELDKECLDAWDDERLPAWLTCKPSSYDKLTSRNILLSRSSTFSDASDVVSRSSTFSEAPNSHSFVGATSSRAFGPSEPILSTYTIEEEDTSPVGGAKASPLGESPDGDGLAGGFSSSPRKDHLWMKNHTRQRSFGSRKIGS
jgi:hypothetical protein